MFSRVNNSLHVTFAPTKRTKNNLKRLRQRSVLMETQYHQDSKLTSAPLLLEEHAVTPTIWLVKRLLINELQTAQSNVNEMKFYNNLIRISRTAKTNCRVPAERGPQRQEVSRQIRTRAKSNLFCSSLDDRREECASSRSHTRQIATFRHEPSSRHARFHVPHLFHN